MDSTTLQLPSKSMQPDHTEQQQQPELYVETKADSLHESPDNLEFAELNKFSQPEPQEELPRPEAGKEPAATEVKDQPEAGEEPPASEVKEEPQEELPLPEAGKEPLAPEVTLPEELPAPEVKEEPQAMPEELPAPEVKEEPQATKGNEELPTPELMPSEQSNESQLPEPKPPANKIVEAQPETCGTLTKHVTEDAEESTAEPLPGPLHEVSKMNRGIFTEVYIAVRGSVVYVMGRVGDSIILIKAKALETADIAQVKLISTFTSVRPQVVRLKNGVLRLQGRALSVPIQIKATVDQAYRSTADISFRCCQSVGDALQRISGKSFTKACLAYNSIATAASAAVSRCYITVRDGAFYMRTQFGGKVSYLKSSVHELCLKLKEGSLNTFSALSRAIEVSVAAALRVAAIPFIFAKDKLQVLYCSVTKGALHIKAKFGDFLVLVKVKVYDLGETPVLATAINALQNTKARAAVATVGIRDAVTPKVQVTAASAASGAVALGIGAGSAGLVAGGAVGAAIGVVPAVFTFGLSIPIGAVMGGGAGLCVGTAAGGTAGFISGGAVGYGAFSNRQGIEKLVRNTVSKADQCKEYMMDKTSASKQYLRAHLIGGTGGTALA